MSPSIHVTAPSRLHFGLLSFGDQEVRQFGGIGVMIDQPALELRISPADDFNILGPMSLEAAQSLGSYARRERPAVPPKCTVEIINAPRQHTGLGTGTQLALALAAGMNAFRGRPPMSPLELASATGRGARSAVGTYGFCHGGLIFEGGKWLGESLSPLVERVALPDGWRFVLVCPRDREGLSGGEERDAFANLPPVPRATTQRLRQEITDCILPAASAADFGNFSESVYRYGYEAGMCFAARQGGAFASQSTAGLVDAIRALGVRGVGQSSWGPTVFALLENQSEAERLVKDLNARLAEGYELTIARPNNTGARIEREDA